MLVIGCDTRLWSRVSLNTCDGPLVDETLDVPVPKACPEDERLSAVGEGDEDVDGGVGLLEADVISRSASGEVPSTDVELSIEGFGCGTTSVDWQ